MRRLRKLLTLEGPKRRVLFQAFLAVGVVRLGLWLLPFKTLCAVLGAFEKRSDPPRRDQPAETFERLMWALRIAGKAVPAATCLPQALAAKLVLHRNGYRPILRLGVTKDEAGKFLAHAWLEHEGTIVIGELRDMSRYASFPPVDFDA
jgi:hypothetical protein